MASNQVTQAEEEGEDKWCHFLVHYYKFDHLVEFLIDNGITTIEFIRCKNTHYHFLCIIPKEVDLKDEIHGCRQRKFNMEDIKVYCDQDELPYCLLNYVTD
jgi:hypothetical protein